MRPWSLPRQFAVANLAHTTRPRRRACAGCHRRANRNGCNGATASAATEAIGRQPDSAPARAAARASVAPPAPARKPRPEGGPASPPSPNISPPSARARGAVHAARGARATPDASRDNARTPGGCTAFSDCPRRVERVVIDPLREGRDRSHAQRACAGAGPATPGRRCFRFAGANKLRPVCRHRAKIVIAHIQCRGGPRYSRAPLAVRTRSLHLPAA